MDKQKILAEILKPKTESNENFKIGNTTFEIKNLQSDFNNRLKWEKSK